MLSANNAVCSQIGRKMEYGFGEGGSGWWDMLSNRSINDIRVWCSRPRLCDIYEGEPNPKREFYNRSGLPVYTACQLSSPFASHSEAKRCALGMAEWPRSGHEGTRT